MKPTIYFRPINCEADIRTFITKTSYFPGTQFGGIVAYMLRDGREEGMGMVGFDAWAPRSVMAHWYIRFPRCIEPLWAEAVKYIALTGRKSILGSTPSNNDKALRSIRHLGWEHLYTIKDGWDEGVDLVISEYKIHGQSEVGTLALRRERAA
jgi:hypothetical protein